MYVNQRYLSMTVAVLLAFATGNIRAQHVRRVKEQSAADNCRDIVALTHNAKINCAALTSSERELIDAIPEIINKILVNHLAPTAVVSKLNEIIADNISTSLLSQAQAQDLIWRRLTAGEIADLNAKLKPCAGQKISIEVGGLETDRVALAKQLAEAFLNTKWDFRGMSTVPFDSSRKEYAHGIILHVSEITSCVGALSRALVGFFGRTNVAIFGPVVPGALNNENLRTDQIELQIWSIRAQ
jgi:hypothetical protein